MGWLPMAHEQTTLTVDITVYSKTCIFRACYKFTDRAYILLSRAPDAPDQIIISFAAKREIGDMQEIIGEFSNELIDQAVREALDERFAPIKNLIVAQAFAEGNLLEDINAGGVRENR
jgi:His-Xaa-Ser system protein HxsD